MADEVFFSKEFLEFLETEAVINMFLPFAPDKNTKQIITKLFRAFAKHGVPAMTVVKALMEMGRALAEDGEYLG